MNGKLRQKMLGFFFVTWYNGGVIENQGQDIGKKGDMERQNNEIQLEFQMTKRIFPDRVTMDRFLEQFQNPQAVEDDGHVTEGLFNFYFFMDQKAWSHA